MPDLSLKDRLQPALLDRLSDDDRSVTLFRVRPRRAVLLGAGVTVGDVHRLLVGHGLRPVGATARIEESDIVPEVLEYTAAGRSMTPAQLRKLPTAGPSRAAGDSIDGCCEVDASSAVNEQIEAPERRAISMRRLREAVLRDLGWLLNSSNLAEVVDLAPYPEVRRSVLNYGMPSLAGRAVSAVDVAELAGRIAEALASFEPRLSGIRVIPDRDEQRGEALELAFRVEAELWGQPVAQHLSLRTSIDMMTGDVSVADQAAGG